MLLSVEYWFDTDVVGQTIGLNFFVQRLIPEDGTESLARNVGN
jgi:hypothetical protein